MTDFTDATSRIRLLYGGAIWDSASFDWEYDAPTTEYTFRSVTALDFDAIGGDDIIMGASGQMGVAGHLEIFAGDNLGSIPYSIIDPPAFITDPQYRQYFGFTVSDLGDINGDSYCDLGVTYRAEYGIVFYCGKVFDTLSDLATSLSSSIMSFAGDINGDGSSDFATGDAGFGFGDGRLNIYLGGGMLDSVPDFWLTSWDLPPDIIQSVGYRIASAGDFNGDGFDDIMFSAETWSDSWQKGRVYIIAGDTDIITDVADTNTSPFGILDREFS